MTNTQTPSAHAPVVGLLPLYVKLYDDAVPEIRADIDRFRDRVQQALEDTGVRVERAPVCRVASEFADAVASFEAAGVDAVVTVHLAYSPSLESERALVATTLPIIILDTTPDASFDHTADPAAMMLNHGIHGVQDMCNRLVRAGKPFAIHAGHLDTSDVLQRVRRSIDAAAVVSGLRRARVGLVGDQFAGMGDFQVPFDRLHDALGVTVVPAGDAIDAGAVADAEVHAELAADRERFGLAANYSDEAHAVTTRAGLAVRAWAERERLTGLTINFMATHRDGGLPAMPFLECSKAMERGLGYAGEGDVLTAAWVGALLQTFPDTTFTEMFCPDWAGDALFLSHMGEYNYRVAAHPPVLTTLPFPYTSAADPVVAYGTFRGGPAILANISPLDDRYVITLATGTMRTIEPGHALSSLVAGWFQPDAGVSDFLEEYSRRGATHHTALIYAEPDAVGTLLQAARFLGCDAAAL